ncbi:MULTISPECIES: hypothetical protein [Pseudomonas syringae group]|uniref:hypothetical protein n=1 Tax=Pseudomonas syringae group TaxID=136849 RepID=UPI00076032E2|nr:MULTISPECIES: hypothetical protein [Pseudomonas syringae group]KWS07500.1 hypothetical protein AL064_19005 [Pseudomonas syringae pv. syringae]MBI6749761.1 hypothetical protein [Pseudomonas syringae]MBI6771794.1 hypothetical protein [Pseudomonas syringae]MBI6775221.1 hypothetical protein [Pseudomonas syringae]MBI6793010.1 hypothetical protein [Pseudomonas syringae]
MRGMFNDFAKDNISVLKTNGQRFDGLKASVQKGKVFLWDSSIFIEPKDLIIRHMSNGGSETFEVVEPGFYEAVMDFEAHYQMVVRRMGEAEAEKVSHSTVYNFYGNNARVNNQSVDNSVNTVYSNTEISNLVAGLRSEVEKIELPDAEKLEALDVVDEIKTQIDSPAPKKNIVRRLIDSLPKVESLTTIGASIMTMLGD